MNMYDEKFQQKSKSISSAEPNYFVHFAMRYPVASYFFTGVIQTTEAIVKATFLCIGSFLHVSLQFIIFGYLETI